MWYNKLRVKNYRQKTIYFLYRDKLHAHIAVLTNQQQVAYVFKFKMVFILAASVFSLIYQPNIDYYMSSEFFTPLY
jgi:hypothetical protein